MRVELTKERDDLLAEVAKRQAKEEGWDRKTESLAKVCSCILPYLIHHLIFDLDACGVTKVLRVKA